MPEVDAGIHIFEHLIDAGIFTDGISGPISLTHIELFAWQANNGVYLQPWEVKLIRALSQDYISSSRAAKEASCPPPWLPEPTEEERAAVVPKIRDVLRG